MTTTAQTEQHPFHAFGKRDRGHDIAVALAEQDGADPEDWRRYYRKAVWLEAVIDRNAALQNLHPARMAG